LLGDPRQARARQAYHRLRRTATTKTATTKAEQRKLPGIKAARTKVGKLRGQNLANAEKTNFGMASAS
jgi:hypothetical protein